MKGNKTGVYKVKSQDAVYDAYAKQGDNYYVGETVYVQIPNSDYDLQKFITGRKVAADDNKGSYNFQLPFENFLGLYCLTEYDKFYGKDIGFWANCPQHGNETQVSSGDLIWHWPQYGEITDKTNIFATHLGLEVDMKTLLHSYRPISGKYGFRIFVQGQSIEAEAKQDDYTQEYMFTSDDMYGNPYAYTTGSSQQIVIDIRKFKRVKNIRVYFWQDHNFKDEFGVEIPSGNLAGDAAINNKYNALIEEAKDPNKKLALMIERNDAINVANKPRNIIVTGLNVYLGLLTDDKQEQAVLYTYQSAIYSATDASRTLRLAWIHEANNSVSLIDTPEELRELQANIYWYRYDEQWTPESSEYDENVLAHKLGGIYWRPIETNLMLLTTDMLINRTRTKFKVIVSYQGHNLTSNVLTFTNEQDMDGKNSDLARNDKIILRCAKLDEEGLHDDDAIGDFYVYDENNNILADDNNVLFSNVRYYIEPWIKVTTKTDNTHDGYQRLSQYINENPDEKGNKLTYTINWQWPENFTMISSSGQLTAAIKDESKFFATCGEEEFEEYQKTIRWFQIRPTYNLRYANNDIIAEINIDGFGTITARKTLQFGRAEAFGCEYVPVISIRRPEGNFYIDTATDFEICCLLYDRKGSLIEEAERPNCKFAWKFIGTNPPSDNRAHENYKGFTGNVIRGRIIQADPFVVEVTVTGAAPYPLTVRRGMMVCNNANYMQTHDIQCPDRVEFRSDGQSPIWYTAVFEVQKIQDNMNLLIYPEWKINNTKILCLLQKEKEYPTFVDRYGAEYAHAKDKQYALGMSKQYITGNVASPCVYGQQWTDDLTKEEYFTYIYYDDKETGTHVAQAIAFSRNLYPSSLVNEWDGQSLSLDEDNSAIMSKMIAAGTKDAKNRFTGVMMGDWHEKGDESLDIPGLYGFAGGAQSFGFKTDGTGFIGTSGYGRIEFDGRNALISNPTKSCYINLNPRMLENLLKVGEGKLDPDNQELWYDIRSSGFSQYFLYAQVNKIDSSNWLKDGIWAKKFLEDEKHDYFVVDPNNGVLTSGGIFARYGQIGKETPWYISDDGLTQQNIFGTIYLGNPLKNPLAKNPEIIYPTFDYKIEGMEEIEDNGNLFSLAIGRKEEAADTAPVILQTGIRPDGFLYSKYANLGGWCFNDKEIYAPDKDFRKIAGDNTGYLSDHININSDTKSISFNGGNMVISGANGWFASFAKTFKKENDKFVPDQYLSLSEPLPNFYDMLLDFKNGQMAFAKTAKEKPKALIDGKNGTAYFASGNITLDGSKAEIYCGAIRPNDTTFDTTVTTGYLYLGNNTIIGSQAIEETKTINSSTIETQTPYEFNITYSDSKDTPEGETDKPSTWLGDAVSISTIIYGVQANKGQIENKYNKYLSLENKLAVYNNDDPNPSILLTPSAQEKVYVEGLSQVTSDKIIVNNVLKVGEQSLVLDKGFYMKDNDVKLPTFDEHGKIISLDGYNVADYTRVATRAWVMQYHYNTVKPAIENVNNNLWWVNSKLSKFSKDIEEKLKTGFVTNVVMEGDAGARILKVTKNGNTQSYARIASMDHYHSLKLSDDGTVELGLAQNDGPTGFKISGTNWGKAHLVSELVGKGSAESSSGTIECHNLNGDVLENGPTYIGIIGASLSDTKIVRATFGNSTGGAIAGIEINYSEKIQGWIDDGISSYCKNITSMVPDKSNYSGSYMAKSKSIRLTTVTASHSKGLLTNISVSPIVVDATLAYNAGYNAGKTEASSTLTQEEKQRLKKEGWEEAIGKISVAEQSIVVPATEYNTSTTHRVVPTLTGYNLNVSGTGTKTISVPQGAKSLTVKLGVYIT